jgi:hypothetical protein
VTSTTVSNFPEQKHGDDERESEEHFHFISLVIFGCLA